jgi:CubicO group peptidase (beta-lactamase class C family)
MTAVVDVAGRCADRFAPVREAFERNFQVHGDVGAACAVVEGGQLVVDLWGGHLDLERRSAWGEDTLVNLFSVTKLAPAVCAHLMAQQGRLDLAAPVATYWPEFAGGGKGAVTLADVLAHRCGVPTVREPLSPEDLFDWERITGIIADTEPWFEPGASCAYEAYTFGFIIGEVIRRVDGRLRSLSHRGDRGTAWSRVLRRSPERS